VRSDFVKQLTDLGYQVKEYGDERISIDYKVPVGKFEGKDIELGFLVTDQFPTIAPAGPHLTPRLLPIHASQDIPHPLGGVHESTQFGSDWQYWSRPFPEWEKTDQTVKTYMSHIRRLFLDQ
jgi:hypothetical protein